MLVAAGLEHGRLAHERLQLLLARAALQQVQPHDLARHVGRAAALGLVHLRAMDPVRPYPIRRPGWLRRAGAAMRGSVRPLARS